MTSSKVLSRFVVVASATPKNAKAFTPSPTYGFDCTRFSLKVIPPFAPVVMPPTS